MSKGRAAEVALGIGVLGFAAVMTYALINSPPTSYYIDTYRLGAAEWGYTITGKAMGQDWVFVHSAREFASEDQAESAAKDYRKANLTRGTVDG